MRPHRLLFSLTTLALLSACVAQRKPPPSAPPPPPVAVKPVPPPAPPPPADWRDVAITPGDWSYTESTAAFGTAGTAPLLTLRCDRTVGQIFLIRAGSAARAVPLTLTTTSLSRSFTVANITASPAVPPSPLAVGFAPRDPILDAIAFSRGRFMVEVPGLPTLYLPAWPEIARVIEDCR